MFEEKLTVMQVADLVGVSKDVIYRMIKEGVLPAYRPSPRRMWLRLSEVVDAFAVPVVPRSKLPVVPSVTDEMRTASADPSATARRPSRRASEKLSDLKSVATAYDHLLQQKRA